MPYKHTQSQIYSVKREVVVTIVCEAVWGYICNMETYAAEGKNLEDTVLSLLDRNLCQNHYIYQDSFYNSVRLAETLLDRNGEFVAL
jgi:hypothetical protein